MIDAGLLLAGGASRRMGRDKATLMVAGSRLVDRGVAVLAEVTDVVVVLRGTRPPVSARAPEGVRLVEHGDPGVGPLGAVVAGLDLLARAPHGLGPQSRVAVLAVDQSEPSAALLRRLAQRCVDVPAAVPEVGGRAEPLHAVYTCGVRGCLADRLGAGERSITRALDDCGARRVGAPDWSDLDPAGVFARSFNTPGDLPG